MQAFESAGAQAQSEALAVVMGQFSCARSEEGDGTEGINGEEEDASPPDHVYGESDSDTDELERSTVAPLAGGRTKDLIMDMEDIKDQDSNIRDMDDGWKSTSESFNELEMMGTGSFQQAREFWKAAVCPFTYARLMQEVTCLITRGVTC